MRPAGKTVIEVEAGGAHANNRWRKDLMEACMHQIAQDTAPIAA